MNDKNKCLSEPQLYALIETAIELNSANDLVTVLDQILNYACLHTNSPAGSVILYDFKRDELFFAAVLGSAKNALLNTRFPVDKGKAGMVFSTGNYLVENSVINHYSKIDEKTNFTTQSMVCFPLQHGNTKYGVLQILNKAQGASSYTEQDVSFLKYLSHQATIAIRNAQLFEQMLASSGLYSKKTESNDLRTLFTRRQSQGLRGCFTILFADIRGFSQLCTMLSNVEKIQTILSDFIVSASSVVVDSNGIVNKVIGDGLLAIFRCNNAPQEALNAAFQIIENFQRLKNNWAETTPFNLDFLDIGVGIATDDNMIFGTVGDEEFKDFTIIGSGVNLAAALVKAARDGKHILCDQMTYMQIRGRDDILCEGSMPFKIGKEGPLSGVSYNIYHIRKSEKQYIPADKSKTDYDIFFSYRREGGDSAARSLQQALINDYHVFLDVDRLSSGHFDERLLQVIAETRNFVVFLSPGSLDRCNSEKDWLRKEIVHALKTKRNIIPIILPGFHFPEPESLPEEMRELIRHDAIEYSHRYFYAMLQKFKDYLK